MCLVCQEKIIINKTFKTFFQNFKPLVCNNCFKQKMNYFPYFVIPINKGVLHVFELLDKEVNNYNIYNDYFIPYLEAYFKTNQSIPLIYLNTLDIKMIKLFDLLEIGNLIVFTNYFKEESINEI